MRNPVTVSETPNEPEQLMKSLKWDREHPSAFTRFRRMLRRVVNYTVEANDTTYYSGGGWSNPKGENNE